MSLGQYLLLAARPALRVAAVAAALGGLWIVSAALVSPGLDASPPPESILEVDGLVAEEDPRSEPNPKSIDFIMRPLFRADRRPLVVEKVVQEVATQTELMGDAPGSLEGVELIGVVSSGEMTSAILRTTDGKRVLLRAGQEFEGWVLQSVEARQAHFSSAASSAAQPKVLQMAILAPPGRVQAVPSEQETPPSQGAADGSVEGSGDDTANDAVAGDQQDAQETEDGPGLTFEALDRQRRKERAKNGSG